MEDNTYWNHENGYHMEDRERPNKDVRNYRDNFASEYNDWVDIPDDNFYSPMGGLA